MLCSKPEDTEANLKNVKDKLLNRNYPESLIDSKIQEAKKRPRKELIQQKKKQKKCKG